MLSDETLKVEDVTRMLDLSRNTVYALAKSGELASYRVGRKLYFTLSDVNDYLARARREAPAAEKPAALELPFALTDGTIAIGGVSDIASALADRLVSQGDAVTTVPGDAYAALVKLYLGALDAAVVDLYDRRTRSCNVPFVQRLAPGLPVVVYRLCARSFGFVVRAGEEGRFADWSALLRHDVRIANRPPMSTPRVLLDEALVYMEAVPDGVAGYGSLFDTDAAAIESVRSGVSDVAVVERRSVPSDPRLAFVALHRQWVDVVAAKRASRPGLARSLRRLAEDESFRQECLALSSGPVESFGAVVYES